MPVLLVCCFLASGAWGQSRNYPYSPVISDSVPADEALADTDGPVPGGLQIILSSIPKNDKTLAARPSPYVQQPVGQNKVAAKPAVTVAQHQQPKNTTPAGKPLVLVASTAPVQTPAVPPAVVAAVTPAPATVTASSAGLTLPDMTAFNAPLPAPAQEAKQTSAPAQEAKSTAAPAQNKKLILAAPVAVASAASPVVAARDVPSPVVVIQASTPATSSAGLTLPDMTAFNAPLPAPAQEAKSTPAPAQEAKSTSAPAQETKVAIAERTDAVPAPVVSVAIEEIPAPATAVASPVHEKKAAPAPELVAYVTNTAMQSGTGAAQALSVNAANHVGQDNLAIAVAQSNVAPMMAVSQQSAANVASLVAAEGAGIALAYNDARNSEAKNLGALMPAAGGSSAGPTEVITLVPPAPTVTIAPVPGGPVEGSLPVDTSAAARPAEIMDLPPAVQAESTTAPPVEEYVSQKLSPQSKAILSKLPPEPKKVKQSHAPVKVQHLEKNPLENDEVRKHEGVGISISVRRPKLNISHQLEEAYDALINGHQEEAIDLYKEVLSDEPDNRLALFGLATTYHRAGQLALARPLYGRLLALYPKDEEGLNNFLVLLGDESPGEALGEMKKLEHTHPDFSPLPAQMAVIYEKMGDYGNAIDSMKHAIEMSPENIKYRYDMAVVLDKAGEWPSAAIFYQQLLTADERGEKIPAKPEEIQERLTFIRSNRPKPR